MQKNQFSARKTTPKRLTFGVRRTKKYFLNFCVDFMYFNCIKAQYVTISRFYDSNALKFKTVVF